MIEQQSSNFWVCLWLFIIAIAVINGTNRLEAMFRHEIATLIAVHK